MRFYKLLYNLSNKNRHFTSITRFTTQGNFLKKFVLCRSVAHVSSVRNSKNHFQCVNNTKQALETEDVGLLETETDDEIKLAKYFLFNNSSDNIINELMKAVSIQEVFKIFTQNRDSYNDAHITQTVLVLFDFLKLYLEVNNLQPSNKNKNGFTVTVLESDEFKQLLGLIESKIDTFNTKYLSYVMLYLNKLGLNPNHTVMIKLDNFMRYKLEHEFNLEEASTYFKSIFCDDYIKPLYQVINIIPSVFKSIDKCDNVNDLPNLIDCLAKVHMILNEEVLDKLQKKIKDLLDKKIITAENRNILLKTILLYNNISWRTEYSQFTSKLILLMENQIQHLTIDELLLLYGVFFKNQEPGEVLSTIQRSAAKYIRQLEESDNANWEKRVKLFSSLIYFSSPLHKKQYRKMIKDYVNNCVNYSELFHLRKLLCYVKIKDEELCNTYWDNVLKCLQTEERNLYVICQQYLNFNTDIEDFRHYDIENYLYRNLLQQIKEGNVTIFPANLVVALSFLLTYGKNKDLTESLIYCLGESYTQISDVDCLKLSQCVSGARLSDALKNKLKLILDNVSSNLLMYSTKRDASILLKASILRSSAESDHVHDLISCLKHEAYISSKTMENFVYCFLTTGILIPEIINKFTYYIVENRKSMLAFNVDKFLFMCYFLGYCPVNGDDFFSVASDIILRDQERLSGLSFLQSALALCYFHKLPNSFIKQIFNVEFLDKLDVELANCYYKDKYPQRVRKSLMELNRAVCLEYPENNVPWFHQKYNEEMHRKIALEHVYPTYFSKSVKEYLLQIVGMGKSDCLRQNIRTPYGYHIDFELNFNSNKEIVSSESDEICKKVALLLVKPQVFTKFFINLKGKYQMKKRHLEMFGYTVSFINIDEWMNLLYAGERLDFIRSKIWLEDTEDR